MESKFPSHTRFDEDSLLPHSQSVHTIHDQGTRHHTPWYKVSSYICINLNCNHSPSSRRSSVDPKPQGMDYCLNVYCAPVNVPLNHDTISTITTSDHLSLESAELEELKNALVDLNVNLHMCNLYIAYLQFACILHICMLHI